MGFAIGLRIYAISILRKSDAKPMRISAKTGADNFNLHSYFSDYVANKTAFVDREDIQRSWFLEAYGRTTSNPISGYIRYGTYGFESKLIDTKTKKENYKRKATDLEEIPLYFQLWAPEGSAQGFAVMQSFQARSCITLVFNDIIEDFSRKFPNYEMRIKKTMPDDYRGTALSSAPVKKITYTTKNIPEDKADRYLKGAKPDTAKIEISIKARRNKNLGALSDYLMGTSTSEQSTTAIVYDGIEFEEAKADIELAGRRRTVGIIGYNSDAGTIEVSDAVKFGQNGHPIFESIDKEACTIVQALFKTLSQE